MTVKTIAAYLKPGDIIWPPERELRLWMRRENAQRQLPESALHLTVVEVCEATPDKRGAWLMVKAQHGPEWGSRPFNFKTRPTTPWPTVASQS